MTVIYKDSKQSNLVGYMGTHYSSIKQKYFDNPYNFVLITKWKLQSITNYVLITKELILQSNLHDDAIISFCDIIIIQCRQFKFRNIILFMFGNYIKVKHRVNRTPSSENEYSREPNETINTVQHPYIIRFYIMSLMHFAISL